MPETEITAKSLLRKAKRPDSWFVSGGGMNLYRGCGHNCAYCDGRAEKYRAPEEFATSVGVKINALEILAREIGIDTARRGGLELWPELAGTRRQRHTFSGFVTIGGGVGDSYQPLESRYGMTRGVLELLEEARLPVHVLTKSALVLRDLDVLERIHAVARVVVSFSISSLDDGLSAFMEPGASPPSARLQAIRRLRERGIVCGVFLVPVIPFLSDTEEAIDAAVCAAKQAGAQYVTFGGMTLKEGRQKEYFISEVAKRYPDAARKCRALYANKDTWGAPPAEYFPPIGQMFAAAARRYRTPPRMPLSIFQGLLQPKDLAIVLLEHMHAMMEMEGKPSPYRYAAFRLSWLTGQMEQLRSELPRIQGIGKTVTPVVEEILDTGTCGIYKELLGRYE